MMSLTQKFLAVFLVVLTLAFTTGVSVYKHHCNYSKQSIISVFVEVTCEQIHDNSCCAPKPEKQDSCCSQPSSQSYCEYQSHCNIGGCCRTEVDIIQIESEYQVSQTKIIDPDLFLNTDNLVIEIFKEQDNQFIPAVFFIDTSPPLYGWRFLTSVHQLKLDIPVC